MRYELNKESIQEVIRQILDEKKSEVTVLSGAYLNVVLFLFSCRLGITVIFTAEEHIELTCHDKSVLKVFSHFLG